MPQTDSIPQAFRAAALATAEALRGIDRVVVAAHVNPDGDAAGSLAAAGHILTALGKEHALVSTTGLPQYLDEFLRGEGLDEKYIGEPIPLKTYMRRSWDNFTKGI